MLSSSQRLVLSLSDEGDGTVMVQVEVASGEFAGRGEACFDLEEFRGFALELEAFSTSLVGSPFISGGYWKDDNLETLLLSLQASCIDTLGHIMIRVEAAEVVSLGSEERLSQRVIAFLRTEPQSLSTFARRLQSLARLECDHAELP